MSMGRWIFAAVLVVVGSAFGQGGGIQGTPAAIPSQGNAVLATKPGAVRVGIGDVAPAIGLNSWVKGTPVNEYAKGRVYVVEFWAMGVAACGKSGPLLGELQTVFKDKGLTVVGVSVMERGGVEEVERYVKGVGERLTQAIGYDATGDAARRFMQPTGQNAIPVVFVIDRDGRLAWIGHPLDGLDRVVERVVAGNWDLAKAKQEADRRAAAENKSGPLVTRLEEEFGANQSDKALATMDELAAVDPPVSGEWIVSKFGYLLLERKDADKAYAYAAVALAGVGKDDAPSLKAMAWMTLAEPGVARRDVVLAGKMAARADEITGHADANVLDTLARAMFDSGDVAGAIEVQKRAAEGCVLPSQRREMEGRVQRYGAGKK